MKIEREIGQGAAPAKEILKLVGVFRPGGARIPAQVLRDFVDKHRVTFAIEPLCKALAHPVGILPYCENTTDHQHCNEMMKPLIEGVWHTNMQSYGGQVWRQLARAGVSVARCTVERLTRKLGLRCLMRGKIVRTTVGDAKAPWPLDRVNRQFRAERPNQLSVSDFRYVSTW